MEAPQGAIPVDQFEEADEQPSSGQTVSSKTPPGAIPVDQFEEIDPNAFIRSQADNPSSSPYGTTPQQALTALEAIGRGASFGLTTKAETALGVPEKNIEERAKENPLTDVGFDVVGNLGSSFIPGVGEGWLLGKSSKLLFPIVKDMNAAVKAGRLALRGMLETMGFATGDEISDAFLHKGHDPEAVAGHIIGSGATGFLIGGGAGATKLGLEHIQNQKYGEYLDNFAGGINYAQSGGDLKALKRMYSAADMKLPKGFEHGIKFTNDIDKAIADKAKEAVREAGGAAGAVVGYKLYGPAGQEIGSRQGYKLAQKWLDPLAENLTSRFSTPVKNKVLVPIMLRAIETGETTGLTSVLDYGSKAGKGLRMANDAVDSLLKVGSQKALHYEISDIDRKKLAEYIDNGGMNQQIDELQRSVDSPQVPGYAEGGEVKAQPLSKSNPLANLYPAQHMMLTTAKGRVSSYLNRIKPTEPINTHMFDRAYEDLGKKKTYERALDVANNPLSVIQHIQQGTILPEHVTHLKSMYPEVHNLLSKKITNRLTEHQINDTRPSYKTLQGLSLLLGSDLDGTASPASIIAAQSVFLPKTPPQQPQQGKKQKKNKPSLSKIPEDYETQEQARDKRRNKD